MSYSVAVGPVPCLYEGVLTAYWIDMDFNMNVYTDRYIKKFTKRNYAFTFHL